jgi:polyisoprenoid-binding protein YceI
MTRTLPSLALLLLLGSPLRAADTFQVDRAHSEAGFQVRHFVTKVRGRFQDFSGTLQLDRARPAASSVEFTIQAKSIDTDSEARDKHLRSADFFDTDQYPTISFKSTKIVAAGKDRYEVTGPLTMRGVTREVTLPVSFLGFVPGQPERAGFETALTINRKDYGILWNKVLDTGGTLLGDDVDVTINIEATRAAPATK